jgi:DNA invertase Pin-like site-specific DNA recombinase
MNALIYARHSTGAQGHGTSVERQLTEGAREAAQLGLPVGREVTDRGLSAFTGSNRLGAAGLATIEADARDGALQGWTVIVEYFDRLSRQGFDETYSLINDLSAHGVSIRAYRDGMTIRAGERLSLEQMMMLLLKSELAREESAKKAARVRQAKAINRQKARDEGRIFTRNGPPWLRAVNGKWQVIEERAKLIRRVFEMSDSNMGCVLIARALNEEGIEPWRGMGGRKGNGFHESWIQRKLSNRAVLGEFQPMTTDERGERVPAGEPVQGYFPAIIDAALFERVNAAAPDRKAGSQGNNKHPERIANLASGLGKCARCGGTMVYRCKAKAGARRMVNGKQYVRKQDDSLLVCSNSLRKVSNAAGVKKCDARSFAYARFERALLDSALHLAMDDAAFANRGELARLATLIAERQRDHDLLTTRAGRLFDEFADSGDAIARGRAREASAQAKALAENIEALKRQQREASGRTTSAAHLARIAEIRERMEQGDPAERVVLRRKVALNLRALIDKISFGDDRALVVFKAGAGLVTISRDGEAHHIDLIHPRREPPKGAEAIARRIKASEAA